MGKGYKSKSRVTTKTALNKHALRTARSLEKAELKKQVQEALANEVEEEQVKKPALWNDRTICEKYMLGATIKQISEATFLSEYRIRKILQAHNVTIRPRGYNMKNITEEEAAPVGGEEVKTEKKEEQVIEEKKEEKKFSNSISFCDSEIKYDKLHRVEFDIFNSDVIVAGLVKDRHDIPFVNKFIFDTLTEKQFSDPEYIEAKAKGFVSYYVKPKPTEPAKTLVVYCTGLQLALSALVSVCAQLKVNLITMHYNSETNQYMPQNTLTIFGRVPNISQISPLKSMEERFKCGVFTYDCTVKDLIASENCMYISLNDDVNNCNSIILFNKDFPDTEIWNMFGDFIKLSKSENLHNKKHNIMMGNIKVSLAGYSWGENIAKSYNYRLEKKTTFTL